MKTFFTLSVLILMISACSSSKTESTEETFQPQAPVYYEIPYELKDINRYTDLIRSYSEHLSGRTVFLDPGHGGADRSNTSWNGKVVEADVNLNVALYVREFLQSAGAAVIMSRTRDTTISLEQRSKMANDSGADIFISIHHNSSVKPGDNWTNYTVTFYHAREGNSKYNPFEHTLAKYVQRDLAYAMRNSGGLGSFDGTQSDYNIYPGEGLAVLRETSIPAILVECSFFTNRLEEQRLSIDEFNRIEGWGIFQGMAKMFSKGIPEFEMNREKSIIRKNSLHLNFDIPGESRVDESTIQIYFDEKLVAHRYNSEEGYLSIVLDGIEKGEHDLKIELANKNGIYAFPYRRKIVIN